MSIDLQAIKDRFDKMNYDSTKALSGDIEALIAEVERLTKLNTCMSCSGQIDSQCCTICESCWQKGEEGIVIRNQ